MNAPTIQMQPVRSSNISALGYDAASKTLEVHFASGSKYRYSDVPQEHFDKMLAADSKGSHFSQHIRGKFVGAKVEEPKKDEVAAKSARESSWPFPSRQA